MNLFDAHTQWASRPEDERYETLEDLRKATEARRRVSTDVARVRMRDVSFAAVIEDDAPAGAAPRMAVRFGDGNPGGLLTHWSMGQVCTRVGAPRSFLSEIDPALAADCLTDRARRSELEPGRVLLARNGVPVVRAFHGSKYERLWDDEVVASIQHRLPQGWRNPSAYAGGRFGAERVPSGLYASDRDMFAFLVSGGEYDWQKGFLEIGDDRKLHRGFFVWNSEVGNTSFGWTSFWFDKVCGNHIIWGATDVETVRVRHRSAVRHVFDRGFRAFLAGLESSDTRDAMAETVRKAKAEVAVALQGKDEDTLAVAVPRFKREGFTEGQVVGALQAIHEEESSQNGTRWDWLQGFTAIARKAPHIADRVALERRAAKALL